MTHKLKGILIAAVAIAALAAGSAAIAGAAGGDDADKPITGDAVGKASAAALERTGAGRVTATEVGDEEGYYEVEIVRNDGSQVDVHLDRDFKVLDQQGDDRGSGEQDGPNDD